MQAGFSNVPIREHRLAIAGKVVDGFSKQPIAGVMVTIVSGPPAFHRILAIAQARPDRSITAIDGCFCFVDLPEGEYTVDFEAPRELRFGAVPSQHFTNKPDPIHHLVSGSKLIELPPTGVRGKVIAKDSKDTIPLARIRVEDSGEVGYSDATGSFCITGIEPDKDAERTLSFTASGYGKLTKKVTISLGSITDLQTVELKTT